MISAPDILSEELATALGWTVFHSLWQALLIALVVAGASFLFRRHAAQVRYLIGNLGLLAVLGVSVLTFLNLYHPTPSVEGPSTGVVILNNSVMITSTAAVAPQTILQQWLAYFEPHLPLIVTVWMIGAALFGLRMLGGLLFLQQLRHRGVRLPARRWNAVVQELADQLGIRGHVGLLESVRVQVPMVIGYFKPVILMPVGAVNALTPQQVEAILAHELAHIARADYLFNLLQSMVEVLYYFNPGVWWISANIREERENCCDDIAVELCGDNLDYARALVQLQELGWQRPPLAMTFTGKKRQLLQRVRRLLYQTQSSTRYMQWRFVATLCLLLFLVVLSGGMGDPATASPYPGPNLEELVPMTRDNSLKPLDALEANLSPIHVASALDTIPRGRSRLEIVRGDDSHVEVLTENGKIRELSLDGRRIPADSLANYEEMISDLYEEMEDPNARNELRRFRLRAPGNAYVFTPPTPPTPPAPPAPPAAARPPFPPAPPAVVAPYGGQKKITSETDEEGNTVLRIEDPDGEVTEIRVQPDDEGPVIILDGKVVDPEEATIILKESPRVFFRDSALFKFDTLQWNGFLHDRMDDLKDWKFEMEDFTFDLDSLTNGVLALPGGNWSWSSDSTGFGKEWNFNDFPGKMLNIQTNIQVDSLMKDKFRFYNFSEGNVWDSSVQDAFERQMREDGLLEGNAKGYSLKFSRGEMTLNGKKQPQQVLDQYIDLYEEVTDSYLNPGTNFVIRTAPEED